MTINGFDLDLVLAGYVTCALWSTNDESTPQGGEPFDANYGESDLSEEAQTTLRNDCHEFLVKAGAVLESYRHERSTVNATVDEVLGHDLWLTRNGHGTGFWDRDEVPKATRDVLTALAKFAGERGLYLGDDGKIHTH